MEIRTGQLEHPAVVALLRGHLEALVGLTPLEAVHALGLERLKAPDITFWSAWEGGEVLGCVALRALGPGEGELKSMRTAQSHLRRGVATRLLAAVLDEARCRGYGRLRLETGTAPGFAPAHALYRRAGFVDCGPFADYREGPHSRFMSLAFAPD